jgi:hypothetical protein
MGLYKILVEIICASGIVNIYTDRIGVVFVTIIPAQRKKELVV